VDASIAGAASNSEVDVRACTNSGMMSESWKTRFARSLMCMRASEDMSLRAPVRQRARRDVSSTDALVSGVECAELQVLRRRRLHVVELQRVRIQPAHLHARRESRLATTTGCRLRSATYLQRVQHEADVAVAALDESLHGDVVDLQPLLQGDLQHAVANLLLRRPVELQLEAMVLKRPQLLAPAIVADADDRDLGYLCAYGGEQSA